MTEVFLIQVSFLTIVSKQKCSNNNELVEYHGIFIPFKDHMYQNMSHFSSLRDMNLSIISPCLGEANVSTVLLTLAGVNNSVNIQRLHENIKLIMYF